MLLTWYCEPRHMGASVGKGLATSLGQGELGRVLHPPRQGLLQGELWSATPARGPVPGRRPTPLHLSVPKKDQIPREAQKVGSAGKCQRWSEVKKLQVLVGFNCSSVSM